MNKKLSFVLYLIFALASILLFIVVLVSSVSGKTVCVDAFSKITVIASLSMISISSIIGIVMFSSKFSLRLIGFYLLHFGFILFLMGQLIYLINGDKINVVIPCVQNESRTYRGIETEDGDTVLFGFDFGIRNFTEKDYEDGSPEYYEAIVRIDDENETITVNHPVKYGKWKIYLMSTYKGFDERIGEIADYVCFLFKKDNTEFISSAGIIITMMGAFIISFSRPLDKKLFQKKAKKEAEINE